MAPAPAPLHASSAVELKARIEAERAGEPFVVYRDGEEVQQIAALAPDQGPLWIGRGDASRIRLAWDTEVSRLHAELEHAGGSWMLVDDGVSRNGSFVNGERIAGRRRLHDGDVLRVGRTELLFRSPGEAESGATALSEDAQLATGVTESQRRVLVALCRPFKGGGAFAVPATNQQIADEVFLSVGAVKAHLRALFGRFGIEDLPQNSKRLRLVELSFQTGLVSEHEL
jgi:pSer/pThr/pTyr-binding forkhead associated (FHA) protein